MKSSFCIDLQRFMLIPTKFPLTRFIAYIRPYIKLYQEIKKQIAKPT